LTTISNSNIDGRQTLRTVVLNRLLLPSEALVEYAKKAIQDWIGPDLAQLSDFTTFFSLISHSDQRIQTAALISLRQKISNLDNQVSLEQANVVMMIRTLSDSDNPEAFNFIMEALRVLALSLARNGHASILINLLMHKEPKVREGAAAALEAIANGSEPERKKLLEEAIIERLIGHEARLEQTPLHLVCSIIPKLAIDYLNAGRMELILTLVEYVVQFPRETKCTDEHLVTNSNKFVPQLPSRWKPLLVEPGNRRHGCEMPFFHALIRLLLHFVKLPPAASHDLWLMNLWSIVTSSDSSVYSTTKTSVYGNLS
jgi:hypothetical protein